MMETRIRTERKRLGLNQKELATKVGVTPGNVSHWELGINKPRGESLYQLAACFGVSTEWLIYGNKGEVSGDRIKKARKEQGLSQRQLGSMIGVAANNISFWERGVNNPTAGNLKKLADSLCVTIDWLEEGGRNRCTDGLRALKAWMLPDDFDAATFTDSPIALPWINTDNESPSFGQVDYTSLFTFKADLFRLLDLHPKNLAMLSVTDSAMSPTISESDIVFVDTQDKNIDSTSSTPFLLSYKNEKLAIRRIEKDFSDFLIWGDNRTKSQASAISTTEWASFSVIGKVVFKLGSV